MESSIEARSNCSSQAPCELDLSATGSREAAGWRAGNLPAERGFGHGVEARSGGVSDHTETRAPGARAINMTKLAVSAASVSTDMTMRNTFQNIQGSR